MLVTGGAGFLGSSLCERLVNDGHRVVSLDDLSRGKAANLAALEDHERFQSLVADACDPAAYERVEAVLGGVDVVFHLAAVNGTKWFHERARHVIHVNVNATLAALEAAEGWGGSLRAGVLARGHGRIVRLAADGHPPEHLSARIIAPAVCVRGE